MSSKSELDDSDKSEVSLTSRNGSVTLSKKIVFNIWEKHDVRLVHANLRILVKKILII
jgi:hypothetical protein